MRPPNGTKSRPQLSFKADAVAVTHNQHPDHQLRVDRGPPDFAIEWRQLLAHNSRYSRHDRIDAAQEMARWNSDNGRIMIPPLRHSAVGMGLRWVGRRSISGSCFTSQALCPVP